MDGKQFRDIRQELGLTAREFGAALGYEGNPNTLSVTIRRYESGARPIPRWIGRLATMFRLHGVKPDWTLLPERSEEQTRCKQYGTQKVG